MISDRLLLVGWRTGARGRHEAREARGFAVRWRDRTAMGIETVGLVQKAWITLKRLFPLTLQPFLPILLALGRLASSFKNF